MPLQTPARQLPAADGVSRFGLPTPPVKAPDEIDRISARVVSSERSAQGDRVYILDNGQRWRQLDRGRAVNVNDGDRVEIERAPLSGFRLVTTTGHALRVRRIP